MRGLRRELSALLGGAVWAATAVVFAAPPRPLGKNEIRCNGEGCSVGACQTQALLADPSQVMGNGRIVPVFEQGAAVGFKLFTVRPNSLLARMGLQNGDVVKTLNARSLTAPDAALQAFEAAKGESLIRIGLERQGKPLERRLLLDRRTVAAGECPAPKPTSPPPSATSPASPSKPIAPEALARDIQCKETRCVLKNGVFDRLLVDITQLTQGARIVPALADGKPIGFKLFGIRPGSFYALVGLQNGDLITKLAGLPIVNPESALEAYSQLRSLTVIPVELRRRDVDLTLTFEIER